MVVSSRFELSYRMLLLAWTRPLQVIAFSLLKLLISYAILAS